MRAFSGFYQKFAPISGRKTGAIRQKPAHLDGKRAAGRLHKPTSACRY